MRRKYKTCLLALGGIGLWGVGLMVSASAYEPQQGPSDDLPMVITAVGLGSDARSAEADAKRKAIEQAVGVHVNVSTQVENFQVVRDRIETYSQGFIQSMQVLKPAEKEGDLYAFTGRFLISRQVYTALKEGFQAMGLQLRAQGNPDIAVVVQESDSYNSRTLTELVQGYTARNGFYYINLAEALRNAYEDHRQTIVDYEQAHPQVSQVRLPLWEWSNGSFHEESYMLPAPIAPQIVLKLAQARLTYYVLFVKLRRLSPQEASLTVEVWQTVTAKGEGTATLTLPLSQGQLSSSVLEKGLETIMQDPQKGVLPLMYKYLNQADQYGRNLTLIIENYNASCGKQLRQWLKDNQGHYRNKSLGGGQAVYTAWVKDYEEFKEYLEEFDCLVDMNKNIKKIEYKENRIIVYFK